VVVRAGLEPEAVIPRRVLKPPMTPLKVAAEVAHHETKHSHQLTLLFGGEGIYSIDWADPKAKLLTHLCGDMAGHR
jgi:hypothetical protein